jgi:hypothetical protein
LVPAQRGITFGRASRFLIAGFTGTHHERAVSDCTTVAIRAHRQENGAVRLEPV